LQGSDTGQVHESFGEETLTYYLQSGEDVKLLGSDTPGANYVEHNIFLLKLIGAAVSIPYQFLTLDFSVGGAGNNRAALLATYRTFETWQSWLKDKMLQRLWNWRIAKAIKNKEIAPAPIDARGYSEWYKVDWTPPSYDWIDPQKEEAANLSDFKMGTLSLSDITRRRGKDGRDALLSKGKDIADAMDVCTEINKVRGTQLEWRDLIDVAIPGQNQAKPEPKKAAPSNGDTEDESSD
jgi:capsid protein